mgnify:CR=1 FL=1
MEKIKEKPARSERIKEKVVSAPKELLHKGLDDGAERLRTQLRDTAQQGRRDEYGGDDIEDPAVSGSKRAAAELLKQRKKKATEQPSDPARNSASAPDAHRNESPIIRTKDTEFVETQTPAAAPQAQARRAAMQKAAAVKTKDTYIETQVKTSVTAAPEPQRQGQRAFVREQGRKAMRQTRLRSRTDGFGIHHQVSALRKRSVQRKMRRIFHAKVLKRGPVFHYQKPRKKRF